MAVAVDEPAERHSSPPAAVWQDPRDLVTAAETMGSGAIWRDPALKRFDMAIIIDCPLGPQTVARLVRR